MELPTAEMTVEEEEATVEEAMMVEAMVPSIPARSPIKFLRRCLPGLICLASLLDILERCRYRRRMCATLVTGLCTLSKNA